MAFLDLGWDVVAAVLLHLSFRDLAQATATCKGLRQMAW